MEVSTHDSSQNFADLGFDFAQGFSLGSANMLGRFVRLGNTLDKIINQHDYPKWVALPLTECLLLNTLMGSALKLPHEPQGKLSLQIQSKGSVKLISTDYFAAKSGAAPQLRGYVKYDERAAKDSATLSDGVFGVIIDQGNSAQPYSGFVELEKNLTRSAKNYFTQSEQIPTLFHVDAAYDAITNGWLGGAIMLQKIGEDGDETANGNSTDQFRRMEALLGTVSREEILSPQLPAGELIYRLFANDTPSLSTPTPIKFGCKCSPASLARALSIYSQKELSQMITDDGVVTADCQFCGASYNLDPNELSPQPQ